MGVGHAICACISHVIAWEVKNPGRLLRASSPAEKENGLNAVYCLCYCTVLKISDTMS